MDELNWWEITQKLGPQLARFFRSRFSPADSDELVQEVLLRLVDKVEKKAFFRAKGTPEALAWGIALNVQREHHRRLKKTSATVDDSSLDTIADPIQHDHARQQEIAVLQRSIQMLTEPERIIIQMVLADVSLAEISGTLQMPMGTIKSYIHRAKEEIRTTFKQWRML